MRWRPYCPSCMEVSYCTFGFGSIIWHDLRTLSLPRDSPSCPICVRDLSPRGKGNSRLTKLCGKLSYKKNPEVQELTPIHDSKMAAATDSLFKFPWGKWESLKSDPKIGCTLSCTNILCFTEGIPLNFATFSKIPPNFATFSKIPLFLFTL